MKRFIGLSMIISFVALSVSMMAQNATYPFEVKVSGKGKQSILFIPGFASSGEVWESTRAIFEENFKCYALTMAGFAGVEPQQNASFENWKNAIGKYIQENKINKPILVGHSMGGGLAMALAADYPDLISSIVVVDALPCLPALMNPSFQPKTNNDCSMVVSQFTSMPDAQFLQMQTNGMKRFVADTSKIKMIVNWSIKSDRKTFAEMYCDFSNTDLRQKISSIKCPSLILLEPGFATMQSGISEQFKNLKTANLQFANKGLHFIMFDDREWFVGQLINFVKQ
jgi:pimeloyl-ACP methyl ester carboxylesterase